MPLFINPPTPFALYSNDVTVSGPTAVTAGVAYFSEILVGAPMTIAQMRCQVSGTPTGTIDMGIYDASGANNTPGNRLGHTGAIAATTGLFTQNLITNLFLSPGKYWLAFVDTVADSVFLRNSGISGFGVLMQTSATNLTSLPATSGTVVDSPSRVAVMGLLVGGWT